MDQTKGLILATVIITAATTFVRQISTNTVQFRSYLGASFMGIFLTGIGMVNVKLARNFCVLIIFGVLLRDRGHIFTWATQVSAVKQNNANGVNPDPALSQLLNPVPGAAEPPQVAPIPGSGNLGFLWSQPVG